ncbi:MAG: hypothetical protein ABIC82_00535 [bacterium]
MSGNTNAENSYIQIQWTAEEIKMLQRVDEMVFKGGYHLADILKSLNECLRSEKRRYLKIPKEVGYNANASGEHIAD